MRLSEDAMNTLWQDVAAGLLVAFLVWASSVTWFRWRERTKLARRRNEPRIRILKAEDDYDD